MIESSFDGRRESLHSHKLLAEREERLKKLFSPEEYARLEQRLEGIERGIREHKPDPSIQWALRLTAPTLLGIKPVANVTVLRKESERQGPGIYGFSVRPDFSERMQDFVYKALMPNGVPVMFYQDSGKMPTASGQEVEVSNLEFFVASDVYRHLGNIEREWPEHMREPLTRLKITTSTHRDEILGCLSHFFSSTFNPTEEYRKAGLGRRENNYLSGALYGYPHVAVEDFVEKRHSLRRDLRNYFAGVNYHPDHEREVARVFDRMDLANELVEKLIKHYHKLEYDEFYK